MEGIASCVACNCLYHVALAIGLAACNDSNSSARRRRGRSVFASRNQWDESARHFSDGQNIGQRRTHADADGTFSDDGAQSSDGSVVVEQGFYTNNNGRSTSRTATPDILASLSGKILTFVGGFDRGL